jgi:hypothetical protein
MYGARMRLSVNTAWLTKMRDRWLPPADAGNQGVARSVGERFAIPYAFKPELGFSEALIGIGGAFLRILLGSLLFAIWGTSSLMAWAAIGSCFWRITALVLLFLLFLLSMAVLMLAISTLAQALSLRRP